MALAGWLHIIVALFFAIHAVRHGRELYWLIILFIFPLLGSIVYFFAVYLPSTRITYQLQKATTTAAKALDPGRELREAKQAYDLTPTARNQIRLAAALLQSGDADQALVNYAACLKGPFAKDPEIRLGIAKAYLQKSDVATAIEVIEQIKQTDKDYQPEQISLLLAQAYAVMGKNNEARQEFISVIERFGSIEAKIEFAIWAKQTGDLALANTQYQEIQQSMKHWNKHVHALNKSLVKRLNTAFASAR